MKTLDQYSFSGKKALVRVDFNVPLNEKYEITDLTRMKASVRTIEKILNDGGSVILLSHLGRPKDGSSDKYSLKHVLPFLQKTFKNTVYFVNDCIGQEVQTKASQLKKGEILLLENLRFYKEEEKGDVEFAKKLASLGDVYVNDAFGTAHRAHASTAVIAQFFKDKISGYVMQAEIENAQKVLDHPDHPYVAIIGGAKISDKILVIERLLDKVDHLLIGGGMSYTFVKALGGQIGNSLLESDKLGLAIELINKAKDKGVNLLLPVDSVIADRFSNEANRQVVLSRMIPDGWMGLDIGPESILEFSKIIKKAKTILWNGPMGVFEMSHFVSGTRSIAEIIAHTTQQFGAYSLIGGGDSAAAVNQFGFGDQVSYISTGGGALLEYMEGKILPGIEALG